MTPAVERGERGSTDGVPAKQPTNGRTVECSRWTVRHVSKAHRDKRHAHQRRHAALDGSILELAPSCRALAAAVVECGRREKHRVALQGAAADLAASVITIEVIGKVDPSDVGAAWEGFDAATTCNFGSVRSLSCTFPRTFVSGTHPLMQAHIKASHVLLPRAMAPPPPPPCMSQAEKGGWHRSRAADGEESKSRYGLLVHPCNFVSFCAVARRETRCS